MATRRTPWLSGAGRGKYRKPRTSAPGWIGPSARPSGMMSRVSLPQEPKVIPTPPPKKDRPPEAPPNPTDGETPTPDPEPPPYIAITSAGGMGRYWRFAWSRSAKSWRATVTGRMPVFRSVTSSGRTVSVRPLGRAFQAPISTATRRPGTSCRIGPDMPGTSGTSAGPAQAPRPTLTRSRPSRRPFPLTQWRRPSTVTTRPSSGRRVVRCGGMSSSKVTRIA
jgi:hypothetical protein